ncbi:14290_t:CDS:1, partial [Cetraspora pellucida]
MATNPMPQNVSCLKSLALNILKNDTPEVIVKNVDIPELDPCSRCNKELFLYKIKKPFTILTCAHVFHRSCLEDYVKDLLQCPKCAIEVEPIDYSEPSLQENQTQSTSVLRQISPKMVSDRNTITQNTTSTLISDPILSHHS